MSVKMVMKKRIVMEEKKMMLVQNMGCFFPDFMIDISVC